MSEKIQFCPKCHQPLDNNSCPFCGYEMSTGTTITKKNDAKRLGMLYAVALLIFIAASIIISNYFL